MQFTNPITLTLAILSGLSPLGLADPLSAHVSVDIEDAKRDAFGLNRPSDQ